MEPAMFRYMPGHGGGGGGGLDDEEDDDDSNGGCFLDVYVHGARGIHNICIYADQDVYARFSLTSSPGHAPALSTLVAAAGGASPCFDERLPPLRVRRGRIGTDALKCEVWMRSCAKSVLEDQLLGFALVPLGAVAAAAGARLEQRDFSLSSTDLFHSPAGTVRLSLALRYGGRDDGPCSAAPPERASIASEVVILEPPTPAECYSRVEFPDLNVARENEDMAVQCLPFLHLGEAPAPEGGMEVGTSPRAETSKPVSSDGGKNASTTTTASDDMAIDISSPEPTKRPRTDAASPETPTSNEGKAAATKEMADVFKSPMGDIDMEAEQSAMQRQIMEMYVKSMQQFTESLGRMKLPMDLDSAGGSGVVVQTDQKKPDAEAKKDGGRVFYGSRAFF